MFGGHGRITEAIWATISGWIVILRTRRRMKKPLGRSATGLELALLKTWMRVEETEQRDKESSPIHLRWIVTLIFGI